MGGAALAIIKDVWSSKILRFLIIGIISILLIYVGLHFYGKSRYNAGIDYQTSVYNKEQQALKEQYEKLRAEKDKEIISLNTEIENQKNLYAALQKKRETKVQIVKEKVIEYAKTDNGSKRCLDPNWMQQYQDSLPE